jgi:hypothetical protein
VSRSLINKGGKNRRLGVFDMEPPRPLSDAETKIVRIFKTAAENHAAIKGIKTQWSIYHISREAGLDLSAYPKEGLVIQAVWIAFLSVMKSYTPDVELKYPTLQEFQLAYGGRFDGYNAYELNNLWAIANWMSVLFTFVPAKKNKGFALTIVTKLIEGWYIKYVTGSGQTKATQDRVHIFETEGNVKPSPRGKNNVPIQSLSATSTAGIAGLKLRAGTIGDDSTSVGSGSSYTSRSSLSSISTVSTSTQSNHNSPTDSGSPSSPVSSPRSGDQAVGNNNPNKRRKSIGKSSYTSFPAFGPEHNLFSVQNGNGSTSSRHASGSASFIHMAGMIGCAAPAPQPAPAVATLSTMLGPVLFNNGVSGGHSLRSTSGRGNSRSNSLGSAPSAAPSKQTSPTSRQEIPLLRSISNNVSDYRCMDSARTDTTEENNYYSMTEPEPDTDCDDNSVNAMNTMFTNYDWDDCLTTPRDAEYCERKTAMLMEGAHDEDDQEFQEMLKLLRETSTSSQLYRNTSLTLPPGSCCLGMPDDFMSIHTVSPTSKISFSAVPLDVSLNELGPPIMRFSPSMEEQQVPMMQEVPRESAAPKQTQTGLCVLGMNFKFALPTASNKASSAFDIFDHEQY